jgi:hypothetical protein
MKCATCGAVADNSSGRVCSRCAAATDLPGVTGPAYRSPPSRFDAIEADASYAVAVASSPPVSSATGVIVPAIYFAVGIGVALAGPTLIPELGDHWPLAVCWGLFTVLWSAACLWLLVKGIRFRAAPVVASAAIVVDDRMRSAGKGDDGIERFRYYATLQRRDGSLVEYEAIDAIAPVAASGNAGVAYVKGGKLVGFHRIAA